MFKGFQKPKRLVANTETLNDRYGMFTDDESETLANVLKTKVSLPQALTTSEQEGQPISAKYEMEGGKL